MTWNPPLRPCIWPSVPGKREYPASLRGTHASLGQRNARAASAHNNRIVCSSGLLDIGVIARAVFGPVPAMSSTRKLLSGCSLRPAMSMIVSWWACPHRGTVVALPAKPRLQFAASRKMAVRGVNTPGTIVPSCKCPTLRDQGAWRRTPRDLDREAGPTYS